MLSGLHHVTALAGDPQRNLDFYAGFLGLRLVKETVNFDDPATYHFYFGDPSGTPGTLITFFPWPTAPPGRAGVGQATTVRFSVGRNSLPAWIERARAANIACTPGDNLITLIDPAGLAIDLVAGDTDGDGIQQLHSAAIRVADLEPTARLLVDTLGFIHESGNRFRLGSTALDVIVQPGAERAKLSFGMFHHLAFRIADEAALLEWRDKLIAAGRRVTRVMDRKYFHSIYFREPGNVLFEIATDGPGFAVDEPAASLGTALQLPPWLEPVRDSIGRRLPAVTLPHSRWTAGSR